MVTSTLEAFVLVDLAQDANGAVGTGATKVVHQVVTDAVVLARIRVTVIDVELAVFALEALETLAFIGANKILAVGAILAWIGRTLVNLVLAIAAIVAVGADALVAVASEVATVASILAQLRKTVQAPEHDSRLAWDLPDVAELTGPAGLAVAMEGGTTLLATGSIFARGVTAPIHDLFTVVASPSRRAMTSVETLLGVHA